MTGPRDPERWRAVVGLIDGLVDYVARASERIAPRLPLGLPSGCVSLFVYEDDAALSFAHGGRDQFGAYRLPDPARVKDQAWHEVLLRFDSGRVSRAPEGDRPGAMGVTDARSLLAVFAGRAIVVASDGTSTVRDPFRAQDLFSLGLLDGPGIFGVLTFFGQFMGVIAEARSDPAFVQATSMLGIPTVRASPEQVAAIEYDRKNAPARARPEAEEEE